MFDRDAEPADPIEALVCTALRELDNLAEEHGWDAPASLWFAVREIVGERIGTKWMPRQQIRAPRNPGDPSNTAGTGTSVLGTRRVQNYGANADIAFYSIAATNTLSKTFFGSPLTSATSVGGPQDMPEGATVCHRGKTSGSKCGKITSIAYKPTWSNACLTSACNPVFVRVEAAQAGGDSGGPWVNGNSPIGTHKGGAPSRSVYSKFYRIPSGTSLY